MILIVKRSRERILHLKFFNKNAICLLCTMVDKMNVKRSYPIWAQWVIIVLESDENFFCGSIVLTIVMHRAGALVWSWL